jgi:hypothetical protein
MPDRASGYNVLRRSAPTGPCQLRLLEVLAPPHLVGCSRTGHRSSAERRSHDGRAPGPASRSDRTASCGQFYSRCGPRSIALPQSVGQYPPEPPSGVEPDMFSCRVSNVEHDRSRRKARRELLNDCNRKEIMVSGRQVNGPPVREPERDLVRLAHLAVCNRERVVLGQEFLRCRTEATLFVRANDPQRVWCKPVSIHSPTSTTTNASTPEASGRTCAASSKSSTTSARSFTSPWPGGPQNPETTATSTSSTGNTKPPPRFSFRRSQCSAPQARL